MEKDACGVGSIVNLNGQKSHSVVKNALTMLKNMEHRGATGSDPETGDGAGILVQIPHSFFKRELEKSCEITLPAKGTYGVGMMFFPMVQEVREKCRVIFDKCAQELGFEIIGRRSVPVNNDVPGHESKAVEPYIEQLFINHSNPGIKGDQLERKLYILRNYSSHEIKKRVEGENGDFYIASFSSRTIIYKGQLKTDQLERYYSDLMNERFNSAIAIVHSRFSTNTFPNWKLAQPFRFIAHNGEINTIRGNVNKMKSKEALMSSANFTQEEISKLLPIVDAKDSDSSNLDAVVELLTLSGRTLPHVMMMLVPEVWQYNQQMDPHVKAFYKYHAALFEPWDGPAALFFTDGTKVGATLDRNGLRPVRYCLTKDEQLIMGSEAGAVEVDPARVVKRGRLKPGNMLLADLAEGKLYDNDEIKNMICHDKPYFDWIRQNRIKLRLVPVPEQEIREIDTMKLHRDHRAFGYTAEDLKLILKPMAESGKEPVGSMGADIPLAVLSEQSQHVANYFKQFFAQVSNPPIDPIRERLVMSLFTRVGESLNILDESPEHSRQVHISQPVLAHEDYERLLKLGNDGFPSAKLNATFSASGKSSLHKALDRLCEEAEEAVKKGAKILIISNRKVSEHDVAVPSLLSIGAIHHHLINKRLRTKTGLIVEAGDVWEVHHFATIIGYGASAVYPFMVYDSIQHLFEQNKFNNELSLSTYFLNYIDAVGNGLLKILSKMGISTLQSYQGSQIFECIGLGQEVIQKCFKGTISRLEGLNFEDLEKETLVRHKSAFLHDDVLLESGGYYNWRQNGEAHLLQPEVIHALQKSTKLNDYHLYKEYSKKVRERKAAINLRDLFEFRKRQSIPLEEVEPVTSILKRFTTGAMSFGAISHEAHTTLAIAMNRIGGKSNSGEGGEDESRFIEKPNGDLERSAIKQIASGRFGVTSHYLANADELQIKMAQGAKPGEGGQLPGFKVDKWIGRVRHSTPGVTLISPPPHHDIYSIEDLKQLIFDLKNANSSARINVKLVSEAGVGTIASGVAKAKADVIMISGADGGTGASPLSSIRHAGLPWELGISEAHQTLVKNNLRSRVVLQTDGKIVTAYDVAVATLLGAEEWSLSTAALIVEGCIMMRKCHLNTCPVGVATQDPELRKLFTGDPAHVVNLFTFIATEMREIMASLGFRTINEMVGQANVLKMRSDLIHWKLKNIDLTPVLHQRQVPNHVGTYQQISQNHELEDALDHQLVEDLMVKKKRKAEYAIKNINRSTGTILSHQISKKYGKAGLNEDSFAVRFKGSAGQSFGAFLASGVTFKLEGEANDYLGKGLSGGKIVLTPFAESTYNADENIIIGNVALYGATSGKVFINGMAGERFAVRNSGAEAVVEGVGDHGCEYMTGGKVLILGDIGKNFGAGMSGGMSYLYDPENVAPNRCNIEMISLDEVEEADLEWISKAIQQHYDLTDSKKAYKILKDWNNQQKHFTKIMPNDLKNVMLTEIEKTEKIS
jgi:glutamate synthase (NADPH/NADH) large chain